MRRWIAAACTPLLLAACRPGLPTPDPTATPELARPTPPLATPALPIARPVFPTPTVQAVHADIRPLAAAATAVKPAFVLQSAAFNVGGTYPADYTCDGGGQSPPLTWSGAPEGTSAFALIEQDADVVSADQPFTQWLVYNMPLQVTQLAAGTPAKALLQNGSQQGQNSHFTIGYLGPCPDPGAPTHHYTFELFALDGYVTLETGASIDTVRSALTGHILGQTQLLATLQR